ncbi:hypothetical protein [Stackebrandtia soli]|uniref:hypothetical protein n=1 Tax=Stackebrandtia soli TaxID=1892856 RepID=UPI0039EB4ADE
MKRWMPGIVIGLSLFVINVAARIVVDVSGQGDDVDAEFTVGLYATIAMGVVAAVGGAWWAVRKPVEHVIAELGLGLVGGVLLAVFIGPLIVGLNPFAGAEWLVMQIVFFAVVSGLGAFVGFLMVMMFGADYRSKHLKRVERHYGKQKSRR